MDENLKNQNPCIPSQPWVFQFGIFLSVALSDSRCMSATGPFSSTCNSFFMLFIQSAFLWCSFCSLILLPLHPVVNLSSRILLKLVGRIFFRYFGMPYFWQYLLIYLFKLYCLTCLLFCFIFFHRNKSSRVFLSLAISLVVAISLPDFIA